VFCLGVGLGGYPDGVVFHQLLQWHHLFSSWYSITSVKSLQFNPFWYGVFHTVAYLFILAGLFPPMARGASCSLQVVDPVPAVSILTGFGTFKLIQGLVDHQLLSIHHVNETVLRTDWLYGDIAFLAWGGAMPLIDLLSWRDIHA